jgi:hypothetical protein
MASLIVMPVPDVRDSAGRLRRITLALVGGVVAGVIAYVIANHLATPDAMPTTWPMDGGSKARAFHFVYYTAGLFGAIGFGATLALANRSAARSPHVI